MTDLLFLNPALRPGWNVTVRNGTKWDDIVTSLPFEVVIKETVSGKAICHAEIIGKIVTRANEIPDEILALEHDEGCTTFDGLCDAMMNAYGNNWDHHETVTVLIFRQV